MARSASKSKQGSSLAALAAGLDTRKKPLPSDAKPGLDALKATVKARVEQRAPAVAKPPPGKPPRASSPSKPRGSAPRVTSRPAPAAQVAARPASPAPAAAPARPASPSTRPAPSSQPARVDTRPGPSLARPAALTSLQRSPALPGRTPVASKPTTSVRAPDASNTRRYPRANLQVSARLSLADDPTRFFEATLPTVNISVGGLFLQSSFFLKLGTRLLVELKLPPKGRVVHVKADVVRVESNADGGSGFALRFTEYLDGSEVVLATHFLSPVLREFITAYAKQHRFDASAEYLAHTADVLAAWELKKAELGGDVWSLTSVS